MCGQHNIRASAEENTGKGHTLNPRTEIKISDPAGLEGRDSTDHATATDYLIFYMDKILTLPANFTSVAI